MKKIALLIGAIIGLSAACGKAQTIVSLGDIALSDKQVEVLTWHWERYTNDLGSNYLTKVNWLRYQSTNTIIVEIDTRLTTQYENAKTDALRQAWKDADATKRAAIEAILLSE